MILSSPLCLGDSFTKGGIHLLIKYMFEGCFLNRFGVQKPIYINMIRNPIDRLVSSFYYRKQKRGKPKVIEPFTIYNDNEMRYKLGKTIPSNMVISNEMSLFLRYKPMPWGWSKHNWLMKVSAAVREDMVTRNQKIQTDFRSYHTLTHTIKTHTHIHTRIAHSHTLVIYSSHDKFHWFLQHLWTKSDCVKADENKKEKESNEKNNIFSNTVRRHYNMSGHYFSAYWIGTNIS